MATKTQSAVRFFFSQAGFGYDPQKETRLQGKWRTARELARAERWLSEQSGHTVEWQEDSYPDRSGIEHDGPIFCCLVKVPGIGQESLCGIDLGEVGDLGDPYTRVVVAELALELMPE